MASLTMAWVVAPSSAHRILKLLKASLSTFLGTVQTRLEIVSTEIEEERERLEEILLYAIGFTFCLCMGIFILSGFVVAWFWDTPGRLYVIAALGIIYIVAALGIFGFLKHKLKHKPRLFATTLAELTKDRHAVESKISSDATL